MQRKFDNIHALLGPKDYALWYSSTYRHAMRDKVITVLGGRCVKCGFADKRALQIDHVNGDGYLEKGRNQNGRYEKLLGGLGSYSQVAHYYRVLKNSDKYQLLCANCNWIKRVENREYSRNEKSEPIRIRIRDVFGPDILEAAENKIAETAFHNNRIVSAEQTFNAKAGK